MASQTGENARAQTTKGRDGVTDIGEPPSHAIAAESGVRALAERRIDELIGAGFLERTSKDVYARADCGA